MASVDVLLIILIILTGSQKIYNQWFAKGKQMMYTIIYTLDVITYTTCIIIYICNYTYNLTICMLAPRARSFFFHVSPSRGYLSTAFCAPLSRSSKNPMVSHIHVIIVPARSWECSHTGMEKAKTYHLHPHDIPRSWCFGEKNPNVMTPQK